VYQNSDAGWATASQHVAAAVATQQAMASGSGGALQQLLLSVSSGIRYWWGFCRVLPAGSNHFKK